MDYDAAESAPYDAPFPGEHLRGEDGTIDVSRFPNPYRAPIVTQIHEALEGIDGFGTTAPIHFRFDGPIDASTLPDAFASTEAGSPILLIDVDPRSPERGTRRPFRATFAIDPGPYAAGPLLTLVPVQGIPLREGTLYAAVLMDALRGAAGEPTTRAPAMEDVLSGRVPPGMPPRAFDAFRAAIEELRRVPGIDLDHAIAMTAFRTAHSTAVLRRAIEALEGRYSMQMVEPFAPDETFDEYCVFHAVVAMPVFQEGEPPYSTSGGAWVLADDGAPIMQRTERARLVVTVPRTAMPAGGFPTAVLIRTGAGGDRPLVDRGVRDTSGEVAIAGSGPALEFARAGLAGVSIDGPHGGLRNPDMGDEQFRVFNIGNPIALRDNLRQSAIELVLLARGLDTLTLDASACPGLVADAGTVRFASDRLALMGHSMGASIAPVAAAFEPRYRALILSGAGGSWIENVIHKELPIPTRPAAEALLRYTLVRRRLLADDPVLGMLQWAGESADAQIYARLLIEEPAIGGPRHVLMFQGILDRYIPPPIANALTLSLGLDRAGPGLDASLPQYTPIEALLPLRGRSPIALPASGNRSVGGTVVTAVLAQHPEDGIEDGHEIVFQSESPKAQYRCFLRTFVAGETPRVPDPALADPACE